MTLIMKVPRVRWGANTNSWAFESTYGVLVASSMIS